MFYKTILVHVDESRHLGRRVEIAAQLAERAEAHLIGVAATGIPRVLHQTTAPGHDGGEPAPSFSANPRQQRAQAILGQFEALARAAGVTSCAQRLIDDDAAVAVSRQGLYADLIVLGQGDADDASLTGSVDFPEYVAINSPCPVLIVPRAGGISALCERPLIAWDGRTAAARALRNAIPLLQQATCVRVAVIDTSTAGNRQHGEAGADLIAFLACHGINAEVVRRTAQDDAGHGILSLAAELGCDMLIMGCVGHPHTSSMTLGGATRVVFESATIPVFMSA